jgi:hypothetical protein
MRHLALTGFATSPYILPLAGKIGEAGRVWVTLTKPLQTQTLKVSSENEASVYLDAMLNETWVSTGNL